MEIRLPRIIGAAFEVHNYADVFVDGCAIVEVKVAKCCNSEDEAQLVNELKATGVKVGRLSTSDANALNTNE